MSVKLEEMTDEELLELRDKEDGAAVEVLMERYKYLVKLRARSIYILGGEKDDLMQEGMIGLFRAIRDFDINANVKFPTFASMVITRQLYSAVRAAGRKKFSPLNDAISLSDDEDMGDTGFAQAFQEEANPENIYLNKEKIKFIGDFIDSGLSEFERSVFELYISGMSYTEIAKFLGKDDKSTDNAIQRIRSKIKKIIDNEINT
ncbi:MAG: sigma-70 family RNA polymerase sigma factor [Lachnospiraceae bacterium]|nr:sigma-70 family RNA polymerase sigma factor [Lachnospiraceae bacterium]